MAGAVATRLDAAAIDAFYQRVIAPKVLTIEGKRRAAANSFWRRATLAVFLNAILITFFITGWGTSLLHGAGVSASDSTDTAVNLIFFAIFGSIAFMSLPIMHFKSETKAAMIADIVTAFPGFQYNEQHRLSETLIKRSGLFPAYDFDRGGDLITGHYGDVAVISANVLLVVERQGKNGKYDDTQFRGPVYHLTFPRRFRGETRIRMDGGWLGNSVDGLFAGSMQRVTLEDPVFENVFEVYSTDQVEARYILTTGFMELLLKVAARHGNKLEAAFFDQSMLIKVTGQTSRLQAKNPLRHIDWQAEVTRFVEEFQDAFALADELKLNQRIGL